MATGLLQGLPAARNDREMPDGHWTFLLVGLSFAPTTSALPRVRSSSSRTSSTRCLLIAAVALPTTDKEVQSTFTHNRIINSRANRRSAYESVDDQALRSIIRARHSRPDMARCSRGTRVNGDRWLPIARMITPVTSSTPPASSARSIAINVPTRVEGFASAIKKIPQGRARRRHPLTRIRCQQSARAGSLATRPRRGQRRRGRGVRIVGGDDQLLSFSPRTRGMIPL